MVPDFLPVPGSGAGPSVVPEVLDVELGVLRVSGPGELKSDKLKSEVLNMTVDALYNLPPVVRNFI